MSGKKKEPPKRYELHGGGQVVDSLDMLNVAIIVAQRLGETSPAFKTGPRITDRESRNFWTVEEAIEAQRSRPEEEVREEISQALLNDKVGRINERGR
jgi:hypothetical protein